MEGGSFETGRPSSRGWKNFGRRWTREVGILKIVRHICIIICVSFPLLYVLYVLQEHDSHFGSMSKNSSHEITSKIIMTPFFRILLRFRSSSFLVICEIYLQYLLFTYNLFSLSWIIELQICFSRVLIDHIMISEHTFQSL